MNRFAMQALWVGVVMLVGCKPGFPGQAADKARASAGLKPADRPTFKDDLLSFCGEVIPLVQGRGAPPYTRGLKVNLKPNVSEPSVPVVLTITSLDTFNASCLDAAVQSYVAVLLSCDPSPAPIWEDFSKREWRSRTERPAEGLVVVSGDPEGRMDWGFHFMAAPSQAYRPGEYPFQGYCFSEPGVDRESDRCVVNYRKGRIGVEYSYVTRSIKPWRQVDELVRSTLEGRPATALCPYAGAR